MELIENRTFDEIRLGDTASLVRTLTHKDLELFAIMSGDIDPTHLDDGFAKSDMFHKVVAHGMWSGALISTVLGTQLPGPGTVYVDQTLHFQGAIGLGDTITVTIKVRDKIEPTHRVIFDCRAVNQKAEEVVTGTADVIAPTAKISRPRMALPEVELRPKGRRYELLIRMTHGLDPIRTAVVHPVDAPSLLGAVEAARVNLITPVLVGPEPRIRAAAALAQLDLAPYEIVSTEHSEAAAAQAVAMARAGKVEALMKGALHTDELMHAVVDAECGLRTARRLSHVFAIDAPDYPRPLFITDAAINIYPTLADKRDIIQNAIDLAHALGIPVHAWQFCRRSKPSRKRSNRRWTRRHFARWLIEARLPAVFSTVRLPSTTRSRPSQPGPKGSPRRLPAVPTSSWCRTLKPATCWRSNSSTWQKRRWPASCSARACRSF